MRLTFLMPLAFASAYFFPAVASSDDTSEFLERVESKVYEAAGDHQSLAKRGSICIAQIIKPGVINAPTIVSSDVEAGIIVANNNFKFALHGFLGSSIEDTGRTTMTFEAKDGRFRIVHTNIEQFLEYPGQFASMSQGWSKVYASASGAADMRAAMDAISETVARCVQEDQGSKGDW